jgi:hypothetical protein
VHIYSLQGAAVTIIQSIPSTPFASTVMIRSDGVIFGHAGGGFTLTAGNVPLVGRTERNTAAGNSQTGFFVVPSGTFAGNSALGNAAPGIILDFAANFPNFTPPTNNYSFFAQNTTVSGDRRAVLF